MEYGGHKWGYVEGQVDEDTGTFKGEYEITVFSSTSPTYGNLNGSMKIQIIGDVSVSNVLTLTSVGILKAQQMKVKLESGIIGNPEVLKVYTSNNSTHPYLCKKIQIKLGYKVYEFHCSKMMYKQGGEGDDKGVSLNVSKRIGYIVSMKVTQGSDDPTWVQIWGDYGKTVRVLMSESGFNAGETQVKVLGDYVGKVYKVGIFKLDDNKKLGLELISVEYAGNSKDKVVWTESIEVAKENFVIKPRPAPPAEEKEEEGSPDKPTAPATQPTPSPKEEQAEAMQKVDPVKAQKFFDGSCLDPDTKASIKQVSCEDTFGMLESDFQEEFGKVNGKHFPNLKHMYVHCPENCQHKQPVIGLTLHSKDSNICASAVADRALDHTGGIISVSVTKAQLAYDYKFKTVTAYNIAVTSVPKGEEYSSTVSFAVAKVDSTRFIQHNIRIIRDGSVGVNGRLEVKLSGKWQTVRSIEDVTPESNPNNTIANAACKYLGYKYGQQDPSAEFVPLHQSVPQVALMCVGATAAFPCALEEEQPDEFLHAKDLYVDCMDVDPTDTSKKDGSYSLAAGVFGDVGKGRYPVTYFANEPYVACASAFEKPADDEAEDNSKSNADIFCKAMGYPEAKKEFLKIDAEVTKEAIAQLPVIPKLLGILPGFDAAANVFRPPAEGSFKQECFIVEILCDGTAIPPSQSAVLKEVKRQKFPPLFEVDCSTNLHSRDFNILDKTRGDPGSVFTFKCPAMCQDQGELTGAGLYHANSPICKAGIQQSTLDNSQNGYVSVVTGYPTNFLEGGITANEVASSAYPPVDADVSNNCANCVPAYTFAVVPTNSCYLLGNLKSGSDDKYFIQDKSHVSKSKLSKMLNQNMSSKINKVSINKIKSKKNQIIIHNHDKNKINHNLLKSNVSAKLNQNAKSKSKQGPIVKKLSFLSPNSRYWMLYFNNKVPVFWWVPRNSEQVNMKLDEDSNIDLTELTNAGEIRNLGEIWTLMFGLEFDNFNPGKAVILDVGGPGCYQFIVENKGDSTKAADFEFQKKEGTGTANIFYTKFNPEINVKYNIAIVFQTQESTTICQFFIDGELIASSENLEFSAFEGCTADSEIKLGNDDQYHPFIGLMHYFIAFKTALGAEDLAVFMAAVDDRIIMPNLNGKYSGVTTVDGRPCITAPADAPIPGTPGSPPGPSYDGSFKEPVKEEPVDTQTDELPTEVENAEPEDMGGALVTCTYKGEDAWGKLADGHVKTKPGDFRLTAKKIKCPEDCLYITKNKLPVFGPSIPSGDDDKNANYIYSIDSSICGAAIHAGYIKNAEGGVVIYHLTQGVPGFASTEQNGVLSKQQDKSNASVYIRGGPETFVAQCNEKANKQLKVAPGAVYGIECPKKCFSQFKNLPQEVYGNPLTGYTVDSAVCLAAIHADLLSDAEENYVIIEMFEKKAPEVFKCKYKLGVFHVPCEHRGIRSKTKEAKLGFLFKDSLLSCKYFKYTRNAKDISIRFTKIVGKASWSESDDKDLGIIIKPPKSELDNRIVFSEFDCANSIINFNIRIRSFDEEAPSYIGVIFRYIKNEESEEYYMIKILKDGTEMVKVTNGNEDFINKVKFDFSLVDETHLGLYSFRLQYLINKIDLKVMIDHQISYTELLKEDNYDIHRGKIGLAKVGKVDIEFNLFMTTPPEIQTDSGSIDVDKIVNQIKFEKVAVETFCLTKFKALNLPIKEMLCKTELGYCEYQLETFNVVNSNPTMKESVNHACLKKFRLTRRIEAENEAKKGENACEFLIESGSETLPYEKSTKIDYKPATLCDGTTVNADKYYPAWVENATTIETPEGTKNQCAFTIRYVCEIDLNESTFKHPIEEVEGELDKSRITKCGEGIPSRATVPEDPEIAKGCTGKIINFDDQFIAVTTKRKEWLNKLMCC